MANYCIYETKRSVISRKTSLRTCELPRARKAAPACARRADPRGMKKEGRRWQRPRLPRPARDRRAGGIPRAVARAATSHRDQRLMNERDGPASRSRSGVAVELVPAHRSKGLVARSAHCFCGCDRCAVQRLLWARIRKIEREEQASDRIVGRCLRKSDSAGRLERVDRHRCRATGQQRRKEDSFRHQSLLKI